MVSEDFASKHFAIKKNANVLTKFIDKINAVKVTMIDYPDQERAKKVLVNFSEASWIEDFFSQANEMDKETAINDLLKGNMLGQGLEALQFTFLVSGLDLHDTHALVRNRIGVSYLQQSSAVRPFTNSDIIVPRAFTKTPELLARYKEWVIKGKILYQEMLETGDIAITDARLALPKTTSTWIYVSCNLMTLLAIYSKRSDSQEEYVAMNEMVKQMKQQVSEKFPYMKNYFVSSCDKGTCLHCKSGYKCNCIFKRDEKHQLKPGEKDNWTLHSKTKQEMMLNAKTYETEYYLGYQKITKGAYDNEITK